MRVTKSEVMNSMPWILSIWCFVAVAGVYGGVADYTVYIDTSKVSVTSAVQRAKGEYNIFAFPGKGVGVTVTIDKQTTPHLVAIWLFADAAGAVGH